MSDSDLTDFIAGIGKPAAGGSEAEDQRQPTIFDELDTLRAERTRRGDNRWSCSPWGSETRFAVGERRRTGIGSFGAP
jgi:hypothetical protein